MAGGRRRVSQQVAPVIKYLGSKRRLLPRLLAVFAALPEVTTLLDLFSGTARVGHAAKASGLRVTCNDHNAYAHVLARALVQADGARWRDEASERLAELAALPPVDGWFTEDYCRRSRYLRPENGARVEAARERIARWSADGELHEDLEAILLAALLLAADRVDSTTGVQMAYLKRWAPRAAHELDLRLPPLTDGEGCRALQLDAVEAARSVGSVDLAYLDPPYNQHSYLGNYHVWETLVRWDRPEVYGVACKRVDCQTRKSPFNRKREARDALAAVLAELDARHVVLSFNDEGYLSRAEVEELLRARGGEVEVLSVDGDRYVGARIGVHDPQGRKVGTVGRLRNVEHVFVWSAGSGASVSA